MRSAQLFALGPQTVEVAIGQAEVLKVFRLRGLVRVLLHARERETEGEQESLPSALLLALTQISTTTYLHLGLCASAACHVACIIVVAALMHVWLLLLVG